MIKETLFKAQLFLDCDGVLADFNKLAAKILGMTPDQYERKNKNVHFWDKLISEANFFYDLDLLPDAMELYDAVKHLNPIIITGCRQHFTKACDDKRRWVSRHFGPAQKVIVCESKDKSLHIKNVGDVIVDDWNKYKPLWEAKGGIWVSHTSARNSIEQLKKLNII